MEQDLYAQKKMWRKTVRERANTYPETSLQLISNKIIMEVEKSNEFPQSANILAYWSMPTEVCTHHFIIKWHGIKNFYLPVISGNDILIKKFEGQGALKAGKHFGIMEPVGGTTINPEIIDLVIVPGVAFDMEKNRMGHGKGYYDRLLPHMKAKKYGVCFDFQLFEKIPAGPGDVKMDKVYSDKKVIV